MTAALRRQLTRDQPHQAWRQMLLYAPGGCTISVLGLALAVL